MKENFTWIFLTIIISIVVVILLVHIIMVRNQFDDIRKTLQAKDDLRKERYVY